MPIINYDIRTTKDSLSVDLYKTGTTDILISGHSITNTLGIENIFSFSDEIFENGGYKIKLTDSLLNEVLYNGIDVSCFAPPSGWTFTIQTDASGATNTSQFTLPTVNTYTYNANIDWGDGNSTPLTGHTDTRKTHTYSTAGTYQITISGEFQAFSFNNGGDCKKLKSIDTFITTDMNVIYVIGGFYGCTNLTTIPTDLFRYCPNIVSCRDIFYDCKLITTIPSDLFKYNTGVTSFQSAFSGCLLLTAIPIDLFRYNTNVTTFGATFNNCSTIITIPIDLFRYNINVIYFNSTFVNCTSLITIPTDLFRYNINVTNFNGIFANCTSLITIPTDIFIYNTNVVGMDQAFQGCIAITTIPIDLFRYNTGVTSFYLTFKDCVSLTTIPTDIFRYNVFVELFASTFDSCISITTIPNDLFVYNTHVTSFDNTFNNCRNISLPTTIFNLSTIHLVIGTGFENFMNCTSTAYSNTGTIQDIWTGMATAQPNAFKNQTSLTNYASIPSGWK